MAPRTMILKALCTDDFNTFKAVLSFKINFLFPSFLPINTIGTKS